MSYSVVTIGGGLVGPSGIVSVPSSLPSTVNSLLQSYLNGLGTISSSGYENLDEATGSDNSVSGSGAALLEVITNTDDKGRTASGITTPNVLVRADATTLVVQAPGD